MACIVPRNVPRPEQVCSACLQPCTHSRLFCDTCCTWVHTHCESIDAEKEKGFEQLPADFPFICRRCRCDAEGNVDFEKAAARLHKAAIQGFKKLQYGVKREQLFLDGGFLGLSGIGNLAVDLYSQAILESYSPDQNGIPACTTAEGQALFCAVSLAVSARESLATELRVRCCIEMVAFDSYYRWQKNHAALASCAPDYTDSCLDCAIAGEAASVWMMSAMPSVVNRPLVSVYPNTGSPTSPAHKVLNTTFYPRSEGMSSQPVKIMWTNKDLLNANQKWFPNHFVPLFEQQAPESAPPSPSRQTKQEAEYSVEASVDDNLEAEDPALGEAVKVAMREADREAVPVAEGGFPMDIPRYMDVYDAFDHITKATEVLDRIPPGRKDNCWFLFDNSYNISNPNKRNSFFDDCGVWDSKLGSVVKAYYILGDEGNLHSLKIEDGVYKMLTSKEAKNRIEITKKTWVTLDPQPDPDRMVICHRYYAFLKRDTTYKRRVLWFTFPPGFDKGRDIAIAEYCGLFPGYGDSHGNSKGRKAYRRTDPKLLEQIAEHLKSSEITPNKLFKDLAKSMGAENTLRDARQIRNLKYKINKKAGKVKPRPRVAAKDKNASTETIIDEQQPFKVVIRSVGNPDEAGEMVFDSENKLMQVSGQTALQLVGPGGAAELQGALEGQTIIIEGLPVMGPTYVDQAVG